MSHLKVCGVSWGILLSHHTQWQNYKACLKVLLWTAGEQPQDLYIAIDPPDFRSKYPHDPRIGYPWSVGPLRSSHIFISSVRIVFCLSRNFERRRIHQSQKTYVSENWTKLGQMLIRHENMMIKFIVVIKSIRACTYCSSRNIGGGKKSSIKRQKHVLQHDCCWHHIYERNKKFHTFLKDQECSQRPKLWFCLHDGLGKDYQSCGMAHLLRQLRSFPRRTSFFGKSEKTFLEPNITFFGRLSFW